MWDKGLVALSIVKVELAKVESLRKMVRGNRRYSIPAYLLSLTTHLSDEPYLP